MKVRLDRVKQMQHGWKRPRQLIVQLRRRALARLLDHLAGPCIDIDEDDAPIADELSAGKPLPKGHIPGQDIASPASSAPRRRSISRKGRTAPACTSRRAAPCASPGAACGADRRGQRSEREYRQQQNRNGCMRFMNVPVMYCRIEPGVNARIGWSPLPLARDWNRFVPGCHFGALPARGRRWLLHRYSHGKGWG